ncbi:MAG: FHA domain-containing protein [Acidimicrobiales bacterium]|nr:FHA domain-containing protein [Acidimicrobiales bacterium]
MQLDDCRLIPLQPVGAGRLARFDGVICLVGDDPTRVATAALFEACRTHRGEGSGLIQKVAGILTRAAGATLPPFAIVAQDGDALLLAVHGSVTVLAEQPGGPLRIGGGEVGTWATSRVLDSAYLSAVTAGSSLGAVPPLVDLHRGVAVADSFVVLVAGASPGDVASSDGVAHADRIPAGTADGAQPSRGAAPPAQPPAPPAPQSPAPPSEPAAAPAPTPALTDPSEELPACLTPQAVAPEPPWAPPGPAAAAAAAPAPPGPPPPRLPDAKPNIPLGFASLPDGAFKIVELRPASGVAAAAPLPTAQQSAVAGAAPFDPTGAIEAVVVRGVHCGRGHFNDPRARYCAVCGLAMFQNSMVLVEGARPPLGVLLLSNGESYPLNRDLVVGREPSGHPDVIAGRAEALVPMSKGPSLSRVHASIRLEGWDVHLVDEGSTNGTFVWDEPRRQWVRLAAQQPYVLRPGDQLALGELTATFETSLQQ